MATTGFVWHELYAWHDTGAGSGPVRAGGWIEPGEPMAENAATKRRLRNLIDACGLLEQLDQIKPEPIREEQLLRVHTPAYLARVRELSADEGGQIGLDAYVGRGSFEIACLAAGGAIAAVDAVLDGRVRNAYALVRPPGHHAVTDEGKGFCVFANIPIAIAHARAARSLGRIAVLDWDVHHGNGTQAAFYEDPDTLTISLHQDNMFPPGSGAADETGAGAGGGYNINVPLPPGSGIGAYRYAFERVVMPALRAFAPELIIVASGFDASAQDPLGRMLLVPAEFARMTAAVMTVADEFCDGRLVLVHEGGYNAGMTAFCGLAVVERLSGLNSGVDDPFSGPLSTIGGQELTDAQAAVVEALRSSSPLLA